jgi:hypothetical protein
MCDDLRKRKGTLIFGQASVTFWLRGFSSSIWLKAEVRRSRSAESKFFTRPPGLVPGTTPGVKPPDAPDDIGRAVADWLVDLS